MDGLFRGTLSYGLRLELRGLGGMIFSCKINE